MLLIGSGGRLLHALVATAILGVRAIVTLTLALRTHVWCGHFELVTCVSARTKDNCMRNRLVSIVSIAATNIARVLLNVA